MEVFQSTLIEIMNQFYSDFVEDPLENYLLLSREYPHLFQKNESLGIVLDREEIKKIEAIELDRLLKKGVPFHLAKEWSRAGIVSFDPYIIWLRDAVRLNNGDYTLYKRVLYTFLLKQLKAVAICGITPKDEVVLIRIWRHALQRHVLEIPRGTPNDEESTLDCALREFKEETGYNITSIESLGTLYPDSGIISHEVEVFFVKTENLPSSPFDRSEGIEGIYTLPIHQALEQSRLMDPFLNFAISRL